MGNLDISSNGVTIKAGGALTWYICDLANANNAPSTIPCNPFPNHNLEGFILEIHDIAVLSNEMR